MASVLHYRICFTLFSYFFQRDKDSNGGKLHLVLSRQHFWVYFTHYVDLGGHVWLSSNEKF